MERELQEAATEDRQQRRRIRDLLLQTPLFSGLPVEDVDRVAQGTHRMEVRRGDVIFHRGDACTGFYVVIFGQIKLMHVAPSGVERVVRLIGAGDSFGEALLFLQKEYIITAEALGDALLLHISRDVFLERLDHDPALARRMLNKLSHHLFILMGDVGAYTMRSGQQRLIGYLFREARGRVGEPFRVEVTKSVIASRLNLTPEHFSRMLHDLSERKLIRVRGREFTILDAEGLRTFHG